MRSTQRSPSRTALEVASVLLFLLQTSLYAQIVATQGKTALEDSKRFVSPMVLDLPVPELQGVSNLRDHLVAGIRQYHCEDASIPMMAIKVAPGEKGGRNFEISGMLLVDESFDRFITVNFQLMGGGVDLGHGRQMNISVEEGKSNRFLVRFKLSKDAAARFDAGAEPLLRLTMHVRKD